MALKDSYRRRVECCLSTVMDVHRSMGEPYDDPAFLTQFEKLRKSLKTVNMELVTERDILLVEKATNALLREFEVLYQACGLGPVYRGPKS